MPASLFKWMFSGVVVAAVVSDSAGGQTEPPALEANTVEFAASDGVFQAFGSGSRALNDMRARLADPEQRAKYREDQRQGILETHYGVAEALQLDAVTFDKLMSLLADQQMERSEYFYSMFAGQGQLPNPTDRMREEADRVTRDIDAQRVLLGQEKLERYQKLSFSLGQRREIRMLDDRLAAADKLNSPQRERLAELLSEQLTRSIERQQAPGFPPFPINGALHPLPSREELQRLSQLQTISANEEIWREMPESNRKLRERAAEFLTQPQLAMLEQMHAERMVSLQSRIEKMRIQAGLSPTIPEQAEVTAAVPATVDRDVKVSIKVAVDGASPKYLTTTASAGKPVSMKIADNLSLEATPIVFDNDAYILSVKYFETGVTGKRLIGNMGHSGRIEPASANSRLPHVGGGGGSVLTGSKGYAVELSSLVEAN